jgi:fructoselysine 6-kinase
MMNLIGVGNNTVDTYLHQGMRYPGGNAVNVAVYTRRLGHPAAYLGWLGNDRNGELIFNALQRENVDVSHCRVVEGTNSYSVVNLVDGDRVFGKGDVGVRSQIALTDVDYAYISQFEIVHTSAYSYLENSLDKLKKASRCLSFDFSHRQDPAYLKAVLPYVDVALFSCPASPDIEQQLSAIYAQGPRLVLVTCGEAGSWLFDGQKVYYQEVTPVEVVDTLGAGDAFAACFLVEALGGAPIQYAMKLASRFAALNCTHYGAFGYGAPI